MKEIKLSGKIANGKVVQVDNEDYETLSQYKWSVNGMIDGRTYAVGRVRNKRIVMHRVIMGITDPKVQIDHIDRNGLNNQRSNLRICTHSQNQANRKKYQTAVYSKYKGVTKNGNSWMSACAKDRKVYSKTFKNEIQAVLWYNEKAKELHGEFAYINVITPKDLKSYEKYLVENPEIPEGKKICVDCKRLIDVDMFYIIKKRGKQVRMSYCKECCSKKYKQRKKKKNHSNSSC